MALAIFDIDGTLVTGASVERRFYIQLVRAGFQGPRQILSYLSRFPAALLLYGGGGLQRNKAYLTGLQVEQVRELAVRWATKTLDGCWHRPALQRLKQHQENGDEVMLLSGTPAILAAAVAATLGLQHAVGTPVSEIAGRFAPLGTDGHVSGEEKLRLAESTADSMGLAAIDVVAYGNSVQDVPLLSWAGTAVAVRPDRRLSAIAQERGWPVIDSDT